MKVSISVGSAYYDGEGFPERVAFVQEAERLGVDSVWSAEAWGMDAVTPLAYLAARTERIRLGTGIMQVSARTASMTAMTALSMALLSGDRFALGLGLSGPQVVEGLHGVAFAHPLGRLREYVKVLRMGLAGERLVIDGRHIVLPRPGGEGKALRLSLPPRPQLPIHLATLAPKSLEFTGEAADGWLGTSFIPEAAEAHLSHIRRGAERAGRKLSDLELQVGASVVASAELGPLLDRFRAGMAFTLGAMGSARTNFYNAAYARAGFEEAARRVQELWVAGKRAEAVAAVPDELILKANAIGSEEMVRGRLRAYLEAGISGLRVAPEGETWKQRLAHLEWAMDLIRQETEAFRTSSARGTAGGAAGGG